MRESMQRTAGPRVEAHSHGVSVEIEKHCWDDMFGWCRAATTEVSGFGLMRYENKRWRVYKVFFPEQKCSTGYTWIGGEAGARLDYSLNRRGLPSWERRFWWHTHYNFGTFWSGTDDNQAQAMAHQNGEYSLSLVINQAGSSLCRMDLVQPIPVMVDNIKVEVVDNSSPRVKRNYRKDVQKWVSPYEYERHKDSYLWRAKSTIELVRPEGDKMALEDKYIFYRNKMMSVDQYSELLICPCLDNTCIDCLDILKPKKVIENNQEVFDYGD